MAADISNLRRFLMRRPSFLALFAAAALAAMAAAPARADAIDGDWCKADGKRMKIRGPAMVTPGGKAISGDYTRHSFVYVVPTGEPGEGETVSIVLLSEYLAHARQGASDAPIQVWNRCPPGVAQASPASDAGV
jgi:hypothetical protein